MQNSLIKDKIKTKMTFFNDHIRRQLSDLIGELKNEVELYAFKSDAGCKTCNDTIQYLGEIAELNSKIKLKVFDDEGDKMIFEKHNIRHVPALIVSSKLSESTGVRFYGIPSGFEVHSLIAAIKRASGLMKPVDEIIMKRILNLNKKIEIKVFVTPTCPNCPEVVITCHSLAFYNPRITSCVIESGTFSELAKKYNVRSVPKIIINQSHVLEGLQTIDKILESIENIDNNNFSS